MYDFLRDAQFPHFRKFTSADYLPYTDIYKKFYAPYADLSPANLVEWLDLDDTLEISLLDKALVLRYQNPFENGEINYLLLEPRVSKHHVEQIYALASPKKGHSVMREQPRALFTALENDSDLAITLNRDSDEYILDTIQHATLLGPQFYRKRYEINAFERLVAGKKIRIRTEHKATKKDRQLLLELLNQWPLTANPINSSRDNREREVIIKAIEALNALPRSFAILSLDQEPIAFILYAVYGNTAIIGHVKVNYELPYVFDYALHRFAKSLKRQNVPYINFEQDLGVKGLRLHKEQLRPLKMLQKVDVSLREAGDSVSHQASAPR